MTTMQERLIAGYKEVLDHPQSTPETKLAALQALQALDGAAPPRLVGTDGTPANAPPTPSAVRSEAEPKIEASDSPVKDMPATARERAALRMGRRSGL